LDKESARNKTVHPVRKTAFTKKSIAYTLLGGVAAAGLLLILGIAGMNRYWGGHSDNYVLIDGKQYTDMNLIRQQALSALDKVRVSREEIFAVLFEE
jgi:hypothetical protein